MSATPRKWRVMTWGPTDPLEGEADAHLADKGIVAAAVDEDEVVREQVQVLEGCVEEPRSASIQGGQGHTRRQGGREVPHRRVVAPVIEVIPIRAQAQE